MAHGPSTWPVGGVQLPVSAGVPFADRPELFVPLLAVAVGFSVGWWRLRRSAPASAPVSRLVWHAAAVAAVATALASPIASRAEHSFLAHMVQHLLLIKVAAPALLLANPFAAALWALPRWLRLRVGRALAPGRAMRCAWRA